MLCSVLGIESLRIETLKKDKAMAIRSTYEFFLDNTPKILDHTTILLQNKQHR